MISAIEKIPWHESLATSERKSPERTQVQSLQTLQSSASAENINKGANGNGSEACIFRCAALLLGMLGVLPESQGNQILQKKSVWLQATDAEPPCSPWCQVHGAGKGTGTASADPVPAESSPLHRGGFHSANTAASQGLGALLLRLASLLELLP